MPDRDLMPGRQVLIGNISAPGTIIGERLPGIRIAPARFLPLMSAVVAALSAAPMVFSIQKNPPGTQKALPCRTLL